MKSVELEPYIKDCRVTSAGHLTFALNRSRVMIDGLTNVLTKGKDYGKLEEAAPFSVLLNDTVLQNDGTECQENLSLDQLRTTLLADHVKELLRWGG